VAAHHGLVEAARSNRLATGAHVEVRSSKNKRAGLFLLLMSVMNITLLQMPGRSRVQWLANIVVSLWPILNAICALTGIVLIAQNIKPFQPLSVFLGMGLVILGSILGIMSWIMVECFYGACL
jgi:hypothetical protein